MTLIKLPFPPSANRLWRAGVGKIYRSETYSTWKRSASWIVAEAVRKQGRIMGPYRLRIVAGRPDKRKRDLDNLLKATSDAIVTGGAVDDDSQCQRIEIEWGQVDGVEVSISLGKPEGTDLCP